MAIFWKTEKENRTQFWKKKKEIPKTDNDFKKRCPPVSPHNHDNVFKLANFHIQ